VLLLKPNEGDSDDNFTNSPTELFMDGWLESQINAGLVKEWQS